MRATKKIFISRQAFTLVELLTVIGVIGVLAGLLLPILRQVRQQAKSAVSLSNLRQLSQANINYANDHRGHFCPAMSEDNNTRWHGWRPSVSAPFEPSKGYLSAYLGTTGQIKMDPVFEEMTRVDKSFELGAGGYGYNATYIGSTANCPYQGRALDQVPHPDQTLMFATTAFATKKGLQEYPFAEPIKALSPSGQPTFNLQPSLHFRHQGKAQIAWSDGHVTAESANSETGPNYYGGKNLIAQIGWAGPTEGNGWWNPNYPIWRP